MALTDPIIQFQKERASVPFQPPTLCTAETFPLLLAGVPALRKIPGLAALEDAGEAYFTSVPLLPEPGGPPGRSGPSGAGLRHHRQGQHGGLLQGGPADQPRISGL